MLALDQSRRARLSHQTACDFNAASTGLGSVFIQTSVAYKNKTVTGTPLSMQRETHIFSHFGNPACLSWALTLKPKLKTLQRKKSAQRLGDEVPTLKANKSEPKLDHYAPRITSPLY